MPASIAQRERRTLDARRRAIDIWRLADGQFVAHWNELNTLDIFTRVGAVPALGRPS